MDEENLVVYKIVALTHGDMGISIPFLVDFVTAPAGREEQLRTAYWAKIPPPFLPNERFDTSVEITTIEGDPKNLYRIAICSDPWSVLRSGDPQALEHDAMAQYSRHRASPDGMYGPGWESNGNSVRVVGVTGVTTTRIEPRTLEEALAATFEELESDHRIRKDRAY